MAASIPVEMEVLELENYHEDITKAFKGLRVVKKPTPRPGPGQVFVRIAAAPCNPSDLVFMQGFYGVKKALPAVPGWEGAGTVVASGGGLMGNWLNGRRAFCAFSRPPARFKNTSLTGLLQPRFVKNSNWKIPP